MTDRLDRWTTPVTTTGRHDRRAFLLRLAALGLGAPALLTACGGGDDHTAPAAKKPAGKGAEAAESSHGTATAAHGPTASGHGAAGDHDGAVSPDEALQRLLDGNARYVARRSLHPNQGEQRMLEVAKGQHPFAAIVSCVDSRVPPELVFDQGLGDLFVGRVAAAIADDAIVGSIEFGVEEFHIPLVLVLGHERCGAVKATIDALAAGAQAPGQIGGLVRALTPAVNASKGLAGDPLDNAVRASVRIAVDQFRTAKPILSGLQAEGKLRIVGARYDLDSGKVDVIA